MVQGSWFLEEWAKSFEHGITDKVLPVVNRQLFRRVDESVNPVVNRGI